MKKISILLLFILVFGSSSFSQYTWTQKTSMPISRYIGCGFTIGTKSYIGTGYSATATALGDWWEYDELNDTWTQKATTAPRSSATAFVINGKGYLALGASGATYLTTTTEYDPTTNTWVAKASFPGQGRFGAAGFSIGNVGYVVCGNLGSASGPYTNEVYGYDASTNSWSLKAPFPGMVRYGGRGEAINNFGYVVGGINGTGSSSSSFFDDLWEYDPSLNTWTSQPPIPALGRNYATTFVLDGKFVVGNGIHWTGFQSDFYAFDPTTDTWSSLPSLPTIEARWAGVGFSNSSHSVGFVVAGNQSFNNPIVITNNLWQLSNTTGLYYLNNSQNLITASAFPNPFTQKTTIQFIIKDRDSYVNVEIYDISGKLIKVLFKEYAHQNKIYYLEFESQNLKSGIYTCYIKTENSVFHEKLILSN